MIFSLGKWCLMLAIVSSMISVLGCDLIALTGTTIAVSEDRPSNSSFISIFFLNHHATHSFLYSTSFAIFSICDGSSTQPFIIGRLKSSKRLCQNFSSSVMGTAPSSNAS